MRRTWSNKADAPNAAMTLQLYSQRYWRGVGDLRRKAASHAMNKSEAQKILSEQLARFSGRSYSEVVPLVEAQRVETYDVHSESGTRYQIEIQFFWDDQPGETIRVMGSIDDGGIRAFVPLSDSLLIPRPESLSV